MEKKQTNFFTRAKPAVIAAFVLLVYTVAGQKMQTFKEHCGSFYESMAHLYKIKQAELDFYQFKSGQTIASIGAQCCHIEAAYAATTDSITFYLEDIDSSKFKKEQADFAWSYYAKLRGRPMTSNYKMILGNEKSTSLPENLFDKILIINSFHEFTFANEMLADIKTKLKPGGILYIDEALPKKRGQLHGVCNHPMLTNEEIIAIFATHGFEYVNGIDFNYRQKIPVRKIFAFRIEN
ncbi:MAG TPA: methyltransferase domain-containing protein [Chitinophagaceae bacterium]|nr:methyltransferase domain-containing protein [Chitinophagaceae bacterium]